MNLAPQNLKNLFEFHADLFDDLLTLRDIGFGIITGQALSSTADRETLIIEKTTDLADDQDILALIVATIAPSLYRL